MSFSSVVKEELAGIMPNARHCRVAELAALVSYGALHMQHMTADRDGNDINLPLKERFDSLVRKLFTFDPDNMGEDEEEQLLRTIKADRDLIPDALILKLPCCKRAFLRGAFMACGSMTDPEKEYHLEFVTDGGRAQMIIDSLMFFGIEAKSVERKKYNVVYVKDSDRIVDILNVIEAHVALMDFENVRILKDMRNSVNRRVNCETANIGKTITAAGRQIEDINYLRESHAFDKLSRELQETAMLRLEYPDSSLAELGSLHDRPVGRSGVNHRLAKLSEIAQQMREENVK
ncbi:MAG: DNA-binding protein WhiA [Lachnospiraceae bacterium]|nr:DNA-binding protein WhiA [Lachnospiraceae bacterium]